MIAYSYTCTFASPGQVLRQQSPVTRGGDTAQNACDRDVNIWSFTIISLDCLFMCMHVCAKYTSTNESDRQCINWLRSCAHSHKNNTQIPITHHIHCIIIYKQFNVQCWIMLHIDHYTYYFYYLYTDIEHSNCSTSHVFVAPDVCMFCDQSQYQIRRSWFCFRLNQLHVPVVSRNLLKVLDALYLYYFWYRHRLL